MLRQTHSWGELCNHLTMCHPKTGFTVSHVRDRREPTVIANRVIGQAAEVMANG